MATKKKTKKTGRKATAKKSSTRGKRSSSSKKASAKKAATKRKAKTAKKKTVKKATTKKKKSAKKASTRKSSSKKGASRGSTARKAGAKKATTKKAATKKASSKKTTTKKNKQIASTASVSKSEEQKPVKKSRRRTNTKKLESIRVALLAKKEDLTRHLQSELSGLTAADKHHLADLEEMASDTQDTDSVCEIMEVGASTLDQIERALARIESKTYGLCEDCGGDIPMARLEALPFATVCVECKRKQELTRSPWTA